MNTTISIPVELREQIKEFGHKGETYAEIIRRLYENAKENQLRTILMDETNTTPIKDAIREAEEEWPES